MHLDYLETLQKFNITPNFFCSKEYWNRAGWTEQVLMDSGRSYLGTTETLLTVVDADNNRMLPTICESTGEIVQSVPYWIGFPGKKCLLADSFQDYQFQDYQFIYDSLLFCTFPRLNPLQGHKWKTVRKNIHRVQREHGHIMLKGPNSIPNLEYEQNVQALLLQWSKPKSNKIFDPDVMINFLLHGENRILLYIESEFVGVLVWDENWKYINFRYCLVKPYPGLSDYARVLFRNIMSQQKKLINDGGSLDNKDLFQYKKRLNPVEIQEIWGWK